MYFKNRSLSIALIAIFSMQLAGLVNAQTNNDSWAKDMLAQRASLSKSLGSDFKPVISSVLKGSMAPEHLIVDITGQDKIYLIAKGVPNYNFAQSVWGQAIFKTADGQIVKLCDLDAVSAKTGWGKLQKNTNVQNKPLQIGSKKLAHGIFAHADSVLCYKLDKKYVSFEAYVGIESVAGTNGGAQFTVDIKPDPGQEISNAINAINKKYPDKKNLITALGSKWFVSPDSTATEKQAYKQLQAISGDDGSFTKRFNALAKASSNDPRWLCLLADIQARVDQLQAIDKQIDNVNVQALQRAIADLSKTFPDKYTKGSQFAKQLDELSVNVDQIKAGLKTGDTASINKAQQLIDLQKEILFSNPLLDFDKLILIKRKGMGLSTNWTSNSAVPQRGYDSEIIQISLKNLQLEPEVIFKAPDTEIIADIDLHFDCDKMMFSMPDKRRLWQVWEVKTDGTGLKQVTPGKETDVHNYDACYLPGGKIIFNSTASMASVPCITGSHKISNLYTMDPKDQKIRQLCFDQEHNWNPTVMNNGRVIYTRWEYTDTPHSNSRLLFHMNPDGTNQVAYYGSNSYWPNSVFYTRPIPDHPTMVVGVVTGHHGQAQHVGELLLFDPTKGRHEAKGVVQRIPGYGKPVEPIIRDQLVAGSWPQFAFPFPLSDKYFLVTAKLNPQAQWGIYLVDVFDNMQLIIDSPDYFLAEPVPLVKRPAPPVIPEMINPDSKEANVFIADIYEGPGLKDIPKGTVKKLRLFSYTYSYDGVGGLYGSIGIDGPWDMRRIIGTVPVEADGSAMFKIPANTPIAIQPLDADGKSLALMRSWFVGMPGELVSCVGCHEPQNSTPTLHRSIAMRKKPAEIQSWYGPTRNYAFAREVQPVLDKYCAGCHDGTDSGMPYLKGDKMLADYRTTMHGHAPNGGRYTQAYADLFPYVRGPGIESDYHLLTPMEFHADTTELIQMLKKGHNNVKLDKEAWDRLYTWIDMNTPYHGSWSTIEGKRMLAKENRRAELRKLYANVDENHEVYPPLPPSEEFVMPKLTDSDIHIPRIKCDNWPFDAATAQKMQDKAPRIIDLGNGIQMKLVYIPAGEFVMGSYTGHKDERPVGITEVEGFWMGELEVTNEMYAQFDPSHDSKQETRNGYQFGVHGYPENAPGQPAIRLSWAEAMDFCQWLSKRTGKNFSLPTETQWEYACRAGSDQEFSFGDLNTDFSAYSNLADAKIKEFANNPYEIDAPYKNPSKYDDYIPKDERFNDGAKVTIASGSYKANPWGLKDMHGNAAEWTRSLYMPYTTDPAVRDNINATGPRVIRGGSWRDRPCRATSSFRLSYEPYHKVFNVGFRVIMQ
ncbi:MAG: SUMF1/EgtB/PvdO family nonheme iron enzyme [Phycisphaerae bacterium]|nr:SUMF1/EgtB/PvdO family nonheme iron enzyme [Phycisphaerae bacterium]